MPRPYGIVTMHSTNMNAMKAQSKSICVETQQQGSALTANSCDIVSYLPFERPTLFPVGVLDVLAGVAALIWVGCTIA